MTTHDHHHGFDRTYWEHHWAGCTSGQHDPTANPYLDAETAHLDPGRALDAGCGAGAEAIRLAEHGWQVTAVDISRAALTAASGHARRAGLAGRIEWVEADLLAWEPACSWDLVVTNYAHAAIPQLDFYRHLSTWVAPGGTLVIIAHLHDPEATAHHHPRDASTTRLSITALFDTPPWEIATAREQTRKVVTPAGDVALNDVIVRVRRIA